MLRTLQLRAHHRSFTKQEIHPLRHPRSSSGRGARADRICAQLVCCMVDKQIIQTASSVHLILTCLASRCEQVAVGRKLKKEGKLPETTPETPQGTKSYAKTEVHAMSQEIATDPTDPIEILAETTVVAPQVGEDAVAAAEEVMDKALEAAAESNKAAVVEETTAI